jgi:hypothetical protein
MTNRFQVKFHRIFCDVGTPHVEYPVCAVIELLNQFHAPDQYRKKLVKIGNMTRDKLMMRFILTTTIYVTDLGHLENPLAIFDGQRVSPTMQGMQAFCGAMLAHLKLMEAP